MHCIPRVRLLSEQTQSTACLLALLTAVHTHTPFKAIALALAMDRAQFRTVAIRIDYKVPYLHWKGSSPSPSSFLQ